MVAPCPAAADAAAARAAWSGQRPGVVQAEPRHQRAQQAEHGGPGRLRADALLQVAGQDHQPAQRQEFGAVEEGALPAGVRRLLARRQAGDVQAIGGDVVGGGCQRHHAQQRDRQREPGRQLQGQRQRPERHAAA
jgi:hypothetical protein